MDIKSRFQRLMSDKSMNLTEFSEAIGLSLRTFQRYYSGERGIPSKILEELTVRMGVSASWLLTGRGTPYLVEDSPNGHAKSPEASDDFVQIQRFAVSASAGHVAQNDEEFGTERYAFNKKWLEKRKLSPKDLSVISVRGDSMEPKFSDKDLVLLDHAQNTPVDGFIYTIRVGNELYVKSIQTVGEHNIYMVSANPEYPPQKIDKHDDAQIIGRVVASMHEW